MSDILQNTVDLLPVIQQMVQKNSFLTVLDTEGTILGYAIPDSEKPIYSVGSHFDDPTGAYKEVIMTGEKRLNKLPKEVMGSEFEGILVPIKEGYKVVGCITYTFPTEQKDQVVSMIKEFKGSVTDISDSVAEIVSGIEDISGKLKEISGKADTVEQNVGEATEIVKKIGKNASKSNILGLNASIEAARSGEAGRGFTVVASEMGKLANDSGSSAKEIDKKLEEVTENLRGMIDANGAANKVAEGHLENIGDIKEKLVNIKELAQKTLDLMEHIRF